LVHFFPPVTSHLLLMHFNFFTLREKVSRPIVSYFLPRSRIRGFQSTPSFPCSFLIPLPDFPLWKLIESPPLRAYLSIPLPLFLSSQPPPTYASPPSQRLIFKNENGPFTHLHFQQFFLKKSFPSLSPLPNLTTSFAMHLGNVALPSPVSFSRIPFFS